MLRIRHTQPLVQVAASIPRSICRCINAALDGLSFTAPPGFAGEGNIQIYAEDLGNNGAGGPAANGAVAKSAAATRAVAGVQAVFPCRCASSSSVTSSSGRL